MIFKFIGDRFRCILQESLEPLLMRMKKMTDTLQDVQTKLDIANANLVTLASEAQRIADLVTKLETVDPGQQAIIDQLSASAQKLVDGTGGIVATEGAIK